MFNVIGRTLAFEVANLFTLFRLTWLPLALLVAAEFALLHLVLGTVSAPGDKPSAGMPLLAITILPLAYVVLQSLALSVVAVQVHRLVLFNERRPHQYFIYPFGWTEFRYILMGMFSITLLIVPLAIAAYWYYPTRMKAPDSVVAAIQVAFVMLAPHDFTPLTPPATAPEEPTLADALGGEFARALNPNQILLEFITQFLMTTYTVAILSFAYKALKGLDGDRPIGEQGEENDPTLHMK